MKLHVGIIIAVGLALLIITLQYICPITWTSEHWEKAISICLLAALVGRGTLSRHSMSETLKMVLAWGGIFSIAIILYSFHKEATTALNHVSGAVFPFVPQSGSNNTTIIRRSDSGHFEVQATVSGAPIRMMVDTGATKIVLSHSDAIRIGINPKNLVFNQIASTSNGDVATAPIRLKSVQIGSIVVENVHASVSSPHLDQSLLGLSFLDRLSGYYFQQDSLTLFP